MVSLGSTRGREEQSPEWKLATGWVGRLQLVDGGAPSNWKVRMESKLQALGEDLGFPGKKKR